MAEKTEKRFAYGYTVSGLLTACVLIIEYALIFFDSFYVKQGIMLIAGYGLLTSLITCNNHGKNVRLRYEQELSLFLKCFMTDFVMGIFLWSCMSLDISILWVKLLFLLAVHLLTIFFLCVISSWRFRKKSQGNLLYLYETKKPVVSSNETVLKIDRDSEKLHRQIEKCDAVYLYDISAISRNDLIKYCFKLGKPVYFTTKLSDVELRASRLVQDKDTPVFLCEQYGIGRGSQAVKRFCDIVFSALLLILLAPLFAVIAACIKAEDGQSVFYRQTRCTKDMKQFEIIKFRSMVVGAEEAVGIKLAEKRDTRLTRAGYVLRKLKLDELPQLVNILKGDMSFVGPRPERPELIEKTIKCVPEFSFRTAVKAGLTGYAQIHGNYHTDFLDKLKWDLMYIENYSLLLDLKIILMTIPAILHGSDDV